MTAATVIVHDWKRLETYLVTLVALLSMAACATAAAQLV